MRLLNLLLKILPKIASRQERKIVLENFISLTTLQGLGYLLPILVIPYLLRIIGPEKFGLIAFAQALMQYFLIFTDYGFNLSASRKISLYGHQKQKTSEIFSSVLTVKIILGVISLLILFVLVNFVPRFRQDWPVYVLSFGTVIGNTLFPVWFYQGKEKMNHITTINGLGGIANAFCVLLIVRGPADYIFLPLINSLFSVLAGFWALYVAFKKFDIEFIRQTYQNINRELKDGWQVFISTVAINAYTATRVFAVGLLTNNTFTGYYSVAERIAGLIVTFPLDSFSRAVYPRINKACLKNKARAIKIMQKIQKATTSGFMITLPIIFLLSSWIVRFFCGEPSPEAAFTLRLLLIAVFFVGANAFRIQFLLVCGEANLYSKVHMMAALIGLPLIFLFIYLFSFPGAALATVFIEAGVFLTTIKLLKKTIPNF